ncbi:restriction endonuclease subunit S [Moellerella wisconsensis]|uniref:restriction endonuclease subunit S n=1 Tax=Moellerella wisconsensis TaxID=158849 RepID=UPI001F4D76D8|nr:restriction endonuclease subunit S [Moellerella wisconsensis]UNH43402.1 restriction endonuclease subunit S [Moellerella wisconsensis]
MSVEVTETGLNLIPAGYKQTEVGVIPEDWDAVCLGDISEVRMCKRILSGQTKKIGAIPFFKIGTFGGEPDAYITHFLYKEFKAKYSFPNKGDILVSAAGTLGKSVVYDGKPAYFQDSNIVWLEVNKYKLLNEYLYHYYKIIKWASSEGSTIARLYNGIIRASIIALPKINEQIAIATALSDVDALISKLENLIAKKRAIKTTTVQQLLTGRTRLPQFALREDGSKKGTKQSELGEIPEDWEVKMVFELADYQKSLFDDGDWIEAEHITNKGIRLIQTGNIGVGRYVDKDTKKYIFKESFEKLKCKELHEGDLLICRLAEPAGRACIFPYIGEDKVITSVDVTIFRPSHEVTSREFYNQYFSSSDWFKSVLEQVGGTTHKRISRGALGRIRVLYPNIEEQTAIATILSDMDEEIQALEQRLSKTRQIKQGMMQELLTGKTRLVND